jgi:hypothetical protein
MLRSIGIFLFCLLFVAEGERYLEWNSARKLRWDDFSGEADATSSFKAFTKSKINMSWWCDGGIFTFEATARFDKGSSWKKDILSDKLLAHEQLHFDLAELYARKMRKHFRNLENACDLSTDELKAHASQLQSEWEQREKQYDNETEHSKNQDEQLRWEAMIAQELRALAKYALN